jgi:hypothetical protein
VSERTARRHRRLARLGPPDPDERAQGRTGNFWKKFCECGNAKSSAALACNRCSLIDGARDCDRRIIRAMRDHRVLTVEELARLADFKWKESLTRTMRRFVAEGRVKQVMGLERNVNIATYIWVGDF